MNSSFITSGLVLFSLLSNFLILESHIGLILNSYKLYIQYSFFSAILYYFIYLFYFYFLFFVWGGGGAPYYLNITCEDSVKLLGVTIDFQLIKF